MLDDASDFHMVEIVSSALNEVSQKQSVKERTNSRSFTLSIFSCVQNVSHALISLGTEPRRSHISKLFWSVGIFGVSVC